MSPCVRSGQTNATLASAVKKAGASQWLMANERKTAGSESFQPFPAPAPSHIGWAKVLPSVKQQYLKYIQRFKCEAKL
jgi:hypothetical protein